MAELDVTVNGRSYRVACEDGKEEHLRRIAAELDERIKALAGSLGQVGDSRLLLLVSLLVADELGDAREGLAALQARPRGLAPEAEAALAATLEALAERVERIAARLEAA
jgi:cell division protein ZapA